MISRVSFQPLQFSDSVITKQNPLVSTAFMILEIRLCPFSVSYMMLRSALSYAVQDLCHIGDCQKSSHAASTDLYVRATGKIHVVVI